jgi:hypothetical protein
MEAPMAANTEHLDADYIIVGAGAMGMAFADELLSASDATMIVIDRRHRPGGHWNDGYPFLRLHGATSLYGVNSRALGSGAIDTVGLNAGLEPLPSSAELCVYYDDVMRQRLLPSGRVTYLPLCDYREDGTVTSRLARREVQVRARKAVVDATYTNTRLPSTHPPGFEVASGVTCIAPNALPDIEGSTRSFTIIGSGKTAMDSVTWLLENRVGPARIRWIRPREAWMLDRIARQFRPDAAGETMNRLAIELECAAQARDFDDLFDQLEEAGALMRLDRRVRPSMFRCATLSRAELAELRRVSDVVRLGHVIRIGPDEIVLRQGSIPTGPDHVHVDCTASGLSDRPPRPVFEDGRITLQMVRSCQPCFSSAIIAVIETLFDDTEARNSMLAPVPPPRDDKDWARMLVVNAENQHRWTQTPELAAWMADSRLDGTAGIAPPTEAVAAQMTVARQRFRESIGPAIANLTRLLAEDGMSETSPHAAVATTREPHVTETRP